MSDPDRPASTSPAPDPVAQVEAYVASLLDALGARDPLEVMAGTPAGLERAVAGLTPDQEARRERPGKWSVRHVVQHLADSELVGAFRFRMILSHDAPELPGYDQDLWADRMRYQDVPAEAALRDFAAVRAANLRILRRATPADLERVMRHAERGDESLARMLRMYAGHDTVHLRQIARIRKAIRAE